MEDFIRDIKAPQLPDWLVKPGLLVILMYKLCPKEFFRKWIWPKIIVEILVEPNPHPGVIQPIRWLGGNIAKSNPVVSFLTSILHRGPFSFYFYLFYWLLLFCFLLIFSLITRSNFLFLPKNFVIHKKWIGYGHSKISNCHLTFILQW